MARRAERIRGGLLQRFLQAVGDLRPLSTYRWLLGLGGLVYLAWWAIVALLLPDSFNPIGSRLFVVGTFLAALLLSYSIDFVRRHTRHALVVCMWVLTGHYFYLYAGNGADPNWIAGAYITVLAVGATFDRRGALALYSLFVLVAMTIANRFHPASFVALPGMATVLLLLNFVLWLRHQAEAERAERLRLEGEKAAAEAVNDAKIMFLANVSHELRTPLTAIIGYSDLIKEEAGLSDEQTDYLGRISRNGRSLLGVVEQILALTDNEMARLDIRSEPTSLGDLVADVVAEHKQDMEDHRVTATISVDPGVPALVQVDPRHLRRIVENLFSNAIKFNPRGKILVQIRRFEPKATSAVEILVQDTGIGIARDNWEKIFAPFTQVQDRLDRSYGGSGIGLTVARRLAQAMGNEVSVFDSELGKGSTFRILLRET